MSKATLELKKAQVIELLGKNESLSDDEVRNGLDFSDQERLEIINKLLKEGKIEIYQDDEKILYKLKINNEKVETTEEELILDIISESGNKGIWSRDIRIKSNLPLTTVEKILKNMESKKLIKKISSVAANKRKLYMLFHIEPDVTVTGGTWYSNNSFESEFVDILSSFCYKYLNQRAEKFNSIINPIERRNKSGANSKEITEHILSLKVATCKLSVEDIETILETLIYDGKIVKEEIDDNKVYFITGPMIKVTGLMRSPCGVCPVRKDCHSNGVISPETCVYFNEWKESLINF